MTRAFLLAALVLSCTAPAHAQEVIEYYGTDHLGSVRVVFDAAGNVIARADYLPFGEEIFAPTGPLPAEQFTGQARDGEAGQDYFHARMYQPRTGRFNAVDPVFNALFNPQKWNRYSYAINRPTSLVDTNGLDPRAPPEHEWLIGGILSGPTIGRAHGEGGNGGGGSGLCGMCDWNPVEIVWSQTPQPGQNKFYDAKAGHGPDPIELSDAEKKLLLATALVAGTAIFSPALAVLLESLTPAAGAATTGVVTAAATMQSGLVRGGSALSQILPSVEAQLIRARPTNALDAVKAVSQGAMNAGYEMGNLVQVGGNYVITHAGKVTTTITPNGGVTIAHGADILLRYPGR